MEIYAVVSEDEEHEKSTLYVGIDKEKAYNYRASCGITLYLSTWVNGEEISEYYKETNKGEWKLNYKLS
ncbi:TPA: hypothetical protein N2D99_002272 [Clostridium botulinum]|nr:hypothetical protein [Clostridium botulinum]